MKKKGNFDSSYLKYKNLMSNIKNENTLLDFSQVDENTESFTILRHDVEFSVERAYNLSLVESENNVSSSYFFQLTNNSYNILSKKNLQLLKKMNENGHKIGLHFHLNGLEKLNKIEEQIVKEANIMSDMTNLVIDRFSFHRPTKNVLNANMQIEGLINAYDKKYFHYVENIKKDTKLSIKYIADSKHQWNYGFPDKCFFKENKKVQILVHPYSWTNLGLDNSENFRSLIKEKEITLIETIDSECNHFRGIKHEL